MVPKWMVLFALVLATATSALAQYHQLGYGEPYELAGNRMVFTTWYWVKQGQFDWVDNDGKTVFAKRSVKSLPGDPNVHWKELDVPHGVRLIAEPGIKGDFPIKPEHPWEAGGIEITSVIRLPDGKTMAWGICKPGGNCYFESTDAGKTWTRPKLGLVEFQGSKENNLGGPGSFRGSYDPTAPPQERFKSVSNAEWTIEEFEKSYKQRRPWSKMALEISPKVVQAVWGYTSPDGMNWKRTDEPLTVECCDGGQYVFWDAKLKKYVLIVRSHMIGPRSPKYPPQKKGNDAEEDYYKSTIRFAIGRSESENFREFPLSHTIIETANDMPPTDNWQFCLYTTIPGAPDHHLMFPTRWQRADDSCVIDLYASHDGFVWHRALAPAVDKSNWGAPDGGAVWALNPGLIELHNGDWILPFRGDLVTKAYPRGAIAQRWGVATWPKGRLMAIEAADRGSFATAAIIAPGATLCINAVTDATGEIRVEAADLRGKPIAGRTFDDSIPINGDQHRKVVEWKGGKDLGVKAGDAVMLRFRMERAKIYCLDFE